MVQIYIYKSNIHTETQNITVISFFKACNGILSSPKGLTHTWYIAILMVYGQYKVQQQTRSEVSDQVKNVRMHSL